MTTNHLSKMVRIYLFASGDMVFKVQGDESRKTEGALPVFSVDTVKEAEGLQVSLCSYRDGRYVLPFSGNVDDMEKVTKLLSDFTELLARGYRGHELATPLREYREAIGAGIW